MFDKHDLFEYVGNNEGDLLDAFIEENATDSELLWAGIEYATHHPCVKWSVEQVLEAVIHCEGVWRKAFDEYCERQWESYRASGPEPERD